MMDQDAAKGIATDIPDAQGCSRMEVNSPVLASAGFSRQAFAPMKVKLMNSF
jgi:hypothetical protein